MTKATNRKNTSTAIVLFSVVGAMVGLAYASVPLYRLFCQITGYGGTPKTESKATTATTDAPLVTVRFDANVNSSLPWKFTPEKRAITVRLGETVLARFLAKNESDETITGTAAFNVTPYKSAQYFNKVECFCFTEQTLKPGEQVSMPVTFFVDPEIMKDRNAKDVKTITLSYTFFRDPASATGKTAANTTNAKDALGASGIN
ncbi:MAG: cytochrome c oxidase assembly protein [Rhodospirillales bacterium]|nr:cytochrome c oxidase assembly protein [Rhodospirillales bacterium]